MHSRTFLAAFTAVLLPSLATAQHSAPVAEAFRDNATEVGKHLIAAAELMPADKYGFKPTPAQMTFGAIVTHLSQGNDFFCGEIGGTKAPTRTPIKATDTKEVLVARLRVTFKFCEEALEHLDDSKLGEQVPWFGGKTKSRATAELVQTGDWADHYSQAAIYLRLNGLLPPTAKKKM